MSREFRGFFILLIISLSVISLVSCNMPSFSKPTPTVKPTKIPPSPTPKPTDTPEPTATFTPEPTEEPSPTPRPPATATPSIPTATPGTKEAIKIYYISKETKGPFGCNEALFYINTGVRYSGNIIADARFALTRILSYHGEKYGQLYNPGYASVLSVNNIELKGNTIIVYLTGTYNKTKDRCDGPRFRDQLRQTLRQFEGIKTIIIYINGVSLGDVISRK